MTADSRPWFLLALTAAFFWLIYLLAPVITPWVSAAALAGGQLLGILLALPAASALNALVRHLRDEYTKSTLYREQAESKGKS